MTRNQLDSIFGTYAQEGASITFPTKILRFIRALLAKAIPQPGVPTVAAPAAPPTKTELVSVVQGLSTGNGYKLELPSGIIRLVATFIRRFGRETTVVIVPPGDTYEYNTTLIGPSDTKEGVTITSAGGEVFKFDRVLTGSSLPANMHFFLENVEVASFDFPARYLGKRFTFQIGPRIVVGEFTNGNASDL